MEKNAKIQEIRGFQGFSDDEADRLFLGKLLKNKRKKIIIRHENTVKTVVVHYL